MGRSLIVVVAAGLLASACEEPIPSEAMLRVPVERVVEVDIQAGRSVAHPDSNRVTARAWLRTGITPEAAPLEPGQCARMGDSLAAPGAAFGPALTLDYGDILSLGWDPQERDYEAAAPLGGRDMAWQPVAVLAGAPGSWQAHVTGVLRFGDAPEVLDLLVLPDGSRVLRWRGDYAMQDVEARVRTASGEWRCASGPGQVVIPWWMDGERDIHLAATRTRRRLLEDRTLVIGRATLIVPAAPHYLAEHGGDVLAPTGRTDTPSEQATGAAHRRSGHTGRGAGRSSRRGSESMAG